MRKRRITVTIDPDVAARLDHLRKVYNRSVRDFVNEALRKGLRDMRMSMTRPSLVKLRLMGSGTSFALWHCARSP